MSDYVYGLENILKAENAELREQNAKLQATIEQFRFMAENIPIEEAYILPHLKARILELISDIDTAESES